MRVVQPRSAAEPRVEGLASLGVDDDTGDRLAVDLGGNRDGEGGAAVEVVHGAIERVDDPADAGGAVAARALLAQQPVVRTGGEQPLDDQRLRGAVHLGHGVRRRGLRVHRARPVQILQQERCRLLRHGDGEVVECSIFGGGRGGGAMKDQYEAQGHLAHVLVRCTGTTYR